MIFFMKASKMEDDCSCCVYANFMHARVLLMVFSSSCYNPIFCVYFENFLNIHSKNDNKSMKC